MVLFSLFFEKDDCYYGVVVDQSSGRRVQPLEYSISYLTFYTVYCPYNSRLSFEPLLCAQR